MSLGYIQESSQIHRSSFELLSFSFLPVNLVESATNFFLTLTKVTKNDFWPKSSRQLSRLRYPFLIIICLQMTRIDYIQETFEIHRSNFELFNFSFSPVNLVESAANFFSALTKLTFDKKWKSASQLSRLRYPFLIVICL